LFDSFQECIHSVDVAVYESILAVMDAPVNVRLGGEVDEVIWAVFFKNGADFFQVSDVTANEFISPIAADIAQIVGVAGVGELIKIHDPPGRMLFKRLSDKVAADKSASAGDKDGFFIFCHGCVSWPS
jgi:hypothetical protein